MLLASVCGIRLGRIVAELKQRAVPPATPFAVRLAHRTATARAGRVTASASTPSNQPSE